MFEFARQFRIQPIFVEVSHNNVAKCLIILILVTSIISSIPVNGVLFSNITCGVITREHFYRTVRAKNNRFSD